MQVRLIAPRKKSSCGKARAITPIREGKRGGRQLV